MDYWLKIELCGAVCYALILQFINSKLPAAVVVNVEIKSHPYYDSYRFLLTRFFFFFFLNFPASSTNVE
jgi:hypothetical protein